ncbi:hypothetical protein ABT373_31805 [Streptomyces sp. NPDC000070]|uniref:hypothetical protein n=1 Tax=Streptomyces sp. NPDC000070 TaxID=3154240 RepID=UPI00332EE5CF
MPHIADRVESEADEQGRQAEAQSRDAVRDEGRGGGDHADEQELERTAVEQRGGQPGPPPVQPRLDDERKVDG